MNTGIFFDLDGTLWDSADKVVESWNETFKENGADITVTIEDIHGVMGKVMKEIADILMSKIPKEERYDLLTKCEIYENELLRKEGGILFEHVEDVFKKLSKEYKLFIVSNCQKGYIEAFLEYYNFGKYITDSENPGVTGLTKGENIKLVAQRNQIDNIIYVGDTRGDFDATKKAQGTFVYAAYGFGDVTDSKYSINSIEELPKMISEIMEHK